MVNNNMDKIRTEFNWPAVVDAYEAIQTIQQAVQADLVAAVEAQGLTVDDYNAIAASQQSPEAAAEVPPEQAEQFSAAAEQHLPSFRQEQTRSGGDGG